MDERPGDVYHVTQDGEYQRQLAAEAAYFDQPRHFTIDVELPYTSEYLNERFSGDSKVPWYETIARHGRFRRGCALGAGGVKQRSRVLEQHPDLHLTIYDISRESLALLDRELGGRFPGRVKTRQADLNFVELPRDTYDLIMSTGCLHHLLNLEHIAYQINQSLTSDGFLFLHDFVAEARFQYPEEKKRTFEAAFEEAQGRHAFLRRWRIVWPDLSDWQYSPFEAVRSDETLEVLGQYLTEVSLCTAGGLLFLMLHLRPVEGAEDARKPDARSGWRRRLSSLAGRLGGGPGPRANGQAAVLERLGAEFVPLDRRLTEEGRLKAAVAFGVYRKHPGKTPAGESPMEE